MSSLGKAALAYAQRLGWRVFPLTPRDKTPLGRLAPNGVHNATSDTAKIQDWWRQEPTANIGLACGDGWFVIDIDPRSNGDETIAKLERENGDLPETARQLTGGGGTHILLCSPGEVKLKGSLGEGVDIKSSGGYIVAAPSVHPSGRKYLWDAMCHPLDVKIAQPPMWVVNSLSKPNVTPIGPKIGEAANCFLARCFDVAGWLGQSMGDSKVAARCPWLSEHSANQDGLRTGDGQDSSTVILAPTESRPLGSFYCSHGHCEGRGNVAALMALPDRAVCLVALDMPKEFQLAMELVRHGY